MRCSLLAYDLWWMWRAAVVRGPNGRTTYWVGRDDGLLRRLEAVLAQSQPLIVDLVAHEHVRIALPPRAQTR